MTLALQLQQMVLLSHSLVAPVMQGHSLKFSGLNHLRLGMLSSVLAVLLPLPLPPQHVARSAPASPQQLSRHQSSPKMLQIQILQGQRSLLPLLSSRELPLLRCGGTDCGNMRTGTLRLVILLRLTSARPTCSGHFSGLWTQLTSSFSLTGSSMLSPLLEMLLSLLRR